MGDRGIDLDALVHRPRVHDKRAWTRQLEAFRRDAVHPGVLAKRRQVPGLLPLPLDAQRHHHVRAFQGALHVGLDLDGREGVSVLPSRLVQEVHGQ